MGIGRLKLIKALEIARILGIELHLRSFNVDKRQMLFPRNASTWVIHWLVGDCLQVVTDLQDSWLLNGQVVIAPNTITVNTIEGSSRPIW